MGMLCSAGLTSMDRILDPYGIWDRELITAQIPVALEIETKREGVLHRAVLAAIATLFGGKKVGTKYSDSLTRVIEEVRDELRAGRGLPPKKKRSRDADTIRKAFGGLKASRKNKGKR